MLVFTFIKPVANITPETFAVAIPQGTRAQAVELKNNFDEKQQEMIFRIYKDKLTESVENEIYSEFNLRADAELEVEKVDETTFGNITELKLRIGENDEVPKEELTAMLTKKFDIKEQDVEIEIK